VPGVSAAAHPVQGRDGMQKAGDCRGSALQRPKNVDPMPRSERTFYDHSPRKIIHPSFSTTYPPHCATPTHAPATLKLRKRRSLAEKHLVLALRPAPNTARGHQRSDSSMEQCSQLASFRNFGRAPRLASFRNFGRAPRLASFRNFGRAPQIGFVPQLRSSPPNWLRSATSAG
jgi:hypothetical protein